MNMPGATLLGKTAAKVGKTPAIDGPALRVNALVAPADTGTVNMAVPPPVAVNVSGRDCAVRESS
jgi:hypothetical protein